MNLLSQVLLIFSTGTAGSVLEKSDFTLNILKLSTYRVISVFHCEENEINSLLNLIKLFTENDFTVETFNIDNENVENDFITFRGYHRNVLLDLDCLDSGKVLEKASELQTINESVYFFLFTSNFNQSVEIIQTKDIQINSKIILIVQNDDFQTVYQVRSPGLRTTKKIYLSPVGNCTIKTCNLEKPQLNYNLEKNQLNVAFVVSIIHTYLFLLT